MLDKYNVYDMLQPAYRYTDFDVLFLYTSTGLKRLKFL